jgi:hypothetical protein
MSNPINRRDFLKVAAVGAGAAVVGCSSSHRANATALRDPYMTCFYQWDKKSLRFLGGPNGLPNGAGYEHIFSMSHAGHDAHPESANAVHALGSSFKYARAIDIWKYKGWQEADDAQLKQWAIEFRKEALPEKGPADYFAFNEMPTGAEGQPELQKRIAAWIRYLHDAGDGGPKLPGVFYLVEENLVPDSWKGGSVTDDLWTAVDETSVIVVGEHYHNQKYIAERSQEQYSDHLFELARWLDESGKTSQRNIARHKYAVLHSSFYGDKATPWEGLQTGTSTPAEYKAYLQAMVQDTRRSPYGRRRISFGPLNAKGLDTNDLLPALAEVLRKDALTNG